jgi:small subunit ribosomal protein S16
VPRHHIPRSPDMHARALGSGLQPKDRHLPERPPGPALEAADTRYVVEVQPITLEDPRTGFSPNSGELNRVRAGITGDARSPTRKRNSASNISLKGNSTEMVKIRLRRVGRKNAPFYRILVADSQSPRDGKFIEIIGQYAPRKSEGSLQVDEARANYWLNQGAQPTDTVRSLLRRAGVLKRRHEQRLGIELKSTAVPISEKADEAAATSA